MTGCPVAQSSRERMLQQETSAVQRWIDGMTEQGVNGWIMTEVGDDQVGLQYGLAGSDMMERDHAACFPRHVLFFGPLSGRLGKFSENRV